MTISGTNGYTGITNLNGGLVFAASDASLGAAPSSYVANQLTLNGGVLINYNGSLVLSPNRGITLGPAGGALRAGFSQGLTVPGIITGSGGLKIALDSGTVILSNTANSYAGGTTIGDAASGAGNGGGVNASLSVAHLANGGLLSSVGTSSNSAGNLVFSPSAGGTATLTYTGGGDSTDRLFTLGGNAAINASGTGPLNFTNPGAIAYSNTGAFTVTLGGSGPGQNVLAPTLGDNSPGATSLAVNGSNWSLTGSNSFSGGTTITAGTLQIGGGGVLGGGSYSGTIANSGAFLVNTSSNQTLGGVISGAGPFYQLGSGVTTLTASNTYTGTTTIGGGTLSVGNGGTGESLASRSISNSGALVFNHADAPRLLRYDHRSGEFDQDGSRRPERHRLEHLHRPDHGRRRHAEAGLAAFRQPLEHHAQLGQLDDEHQCAEGRRGGHCHDQRGPIVPARLLEDGGPIRSHEAGRVAHYRQLGIHRYEPRYGRDRDPQFRNARLELWRGHQRRRILLPGRNCRPDNSNQGQRFHDRVRDDPGDPERQ